ncbi:PEP-CTERM sorting domain-containing protein [Massilia sp. Dwa41.01b]|uniref:PEP-CTERM sorting domain-containing protein n=1 Tax=Massilia sp. Dwa41.01b TaxID=2709302 RepID=UPI00191FBA4F|nr:PEP-CTERM sorting domain-containing protein [Massilia sp. Dwa41.01b]
MNIKSLLAAASLSLFCASSHAGVIYEWQPTNEETPRGITLQLEFDEATVNSGAFSFNLADYLGAHKRPRQGLLSLTYSFDAENGDGLMSYSSRTGFDSGYGPDALLELDLRFGSDGLLSGYIYANDTEHHVGLDSSGSLFTVFTANSDAGMGGAGCGWTTDVECGGASGYLRQTGITPTVPAGEVPEPASLALLGLGVLAAAATRRRKQR